MAELDVADVTTAVDEMPELVDLVISPRVGPAATQARRADRTATDSSAIGSTPIGSAPIGSESADIGASDAGTAD